MKHKTYRLIVNAVKNGQLRESFSQKDFSRACPGLPEGTYNAFLHKHALGNPGNYSELLIRVSPGRFKCIRPFKYEL